MQGFNQALRLKQEVIEANYISSGTGSGPSGQEFSSNTAAKNLLPSSGRISNHMVRSAQGLTVHNQAQSADSAIGANSGFSGAGESASGAHADAGVAWQYFDEREYISAGTVAPGEDTYARNKFNQAASDSLASDRAIPDTRGPHCRRKTYSTSHLPATSVIITFHNEARSTLLRTIVR